MGQGSGAAHRLSFAERLELQRRVRAGETLKSAARRPRILERCGRGGDEREPESLPLRRGTGGPPSGRVRRGKIGFFRRDGRAVEGARLESACTERYRGFESHSLRHLVCGCRDLLIPTIR